MANINLNTIEGLERLKNSLETVVENRIHNVKREMAVNEISNKNVGECKYIFESISNKLFNDKKGKHLIKKYINTIKENNDLRTYYKVFEAVKKSSGVNNPEMLITESAKLCGKISNKSKKKLYNVLSECLKQSKLTIDELNTITESFNNSIDSPLSYVLTESVNEKNIVEYTNALNESVKRIGDKSQTNDSNNKSKDELISDLNNEINEATELFEKNVIEDVSLAAMSGKDNSALFEEYKASCLSLINEISNSDVEGKARISSMREGIEKKQYNEDTFINDILKLSELKETLKETI